MQRSDTARRRATVGRTIGWSSLAGVAGVLMVSAGALPARADAELEAAFALLDENGDGIVARDEFQRSKTQIFFAALDAADADHTLRPEDLRLTPEAFAEADIDGDGILTGSEFVQAPFMQFEAFDADADGAITLEEFLAAAGRVVVE